LSKEDKLINAIQF